MRILQVMAGGRHGGAETAFADMCMALHKSGETVEVVTRANDRVKPMEEAGIKVHTLPFGGMIDVFTPWRLGKIIRSFKPDIVQTWMARASAMTPAWKEQMGISRYPVVARLGGYYNIKYFKNADYFIVNMPDIGRHLTESGAPVAKIRHINNFADIEKSQVPARRADFGTPEDAVLVLALGRLHPAKGFDTLIRAVASLGNAHLWLAGEGELRGEFEKLIESFGAQDRIQLLGWRSDRAALFEACDICAVSSREEPFGNVCVQAWAQKVPLVTTDAIGPRQFVRHGQDALMVPAGDEKALADAIRRIAEDQNLRNELVKNGYRRFQGEFTREQAVGNYLAYYHEIRAAEGL